MGWVALTELDEHGQPGESVVVAPGRLRRDLGELAAAGAVPGRLQALLTRVPASLAGASVALSEPVTYDREGCALEPFPGMPFPGVPEAEVRPRAEPTGPDSPPPDAPGEAGAGGLERVVLANAPDEVVAAAREWPHAAMQVWTQLPHDTDAFDDPGPDGGVWATRVYGWVGQPLVDLVPATDGALLPWVRWVGRAARPGTRLPYWPPEMAPPGAGGPVVHAGRPPVTRPYGDEAARR